MTDSQTTSNASLQRVFTWLSSTQTNPSRSTVMMPWNGLGILVKITSGDTLRSTWCRTASMRFSSVRRKTPPMEDAHQKISKWQWMLSRNCFQETWYACWNRKRHTNSSLLYWIGEASDVLWTIPSHESTEKARWTSFTPGKISNADLPNSHDIVLQLLRYDAFSRDWFFSSIHNKYGLR